ncbi:MAG: hypothetical protein JSV50_15200 [Desulfobacteraceae bacterium]|nr:MAG: hypothetical protein JSV50_15200 [Desulfobacteraceae bacterium]
MTKKERFNAVCKMRAPDYMPVWPRPMSQLIYSMGWLLPDVTGEDWYDSDKCTEAVLWNIEHIGYDIAIPCYTDSAFGVPAWGGGINVPIKFGESVGVTKAKPVKTKWDWPKVQRKLANYDIRSADPRMEGALKAIKNVSKAVGDSTPLVASCYLAATSAMLLFRPHEAFLEDMISEPEWVTEMCRVAGDWNMDWVRAQYEAGANSVTVVADTLGILMISPKMAERYSLPYLYELAQRIRKEFNQGVWLHTHGNMRTPEGSRYLKRIVKETGVEGLHLDNTHPPEWIKENVVDKFGIPACISYDCYKIQSHPAEKIWADVEDMLSKIGDGLGVVMAPCCQVLPTTSNENFKAWVDATHRYGRYPLTLSPNHRSAKNYML